MRVGQDDPILIIGAGLTGLTTAVALQYQGFTQLRLYDRRPKLERPDVPVHLGAHAFAALNDLALDADFQAAATPWQQLTMNWFDGRAMGQAPLGEVRTQSGYLPGTMLLSEVERLLKRTLPAEWFVLDKDFISYTASEKEVQVHFNGGHTDKGALLIGTDGPQSRVRLQMLGEGAPLQSPYVRLRAVFERSLLTEEQRSFLAQPQVIWLGKEVACLLGLTGGDKAWADLMVPKTAPNPHTAPIPGDYFDELFGKFEAPLPEVLRRIPAQAWVRDLPQGREPGKHWTNGRVALLGAAAHPLLPMPGMDTAFYMEEGVLLARLLAENPKRVAKVLKTLEKKRRLQLKWAHQGGERFSRLLEPQSNFGYTFRNWLFRNFSQSKLFKPFTRLQTSHYYSKR
jgi:2-polyprenyl-6-methoxyphenol hydroxylase-like FAD-dependent oxidoreductase